MKKLLFPIFTIFAIFAASGQNVIRVSVNGTGNGTSWANAAGLENALNVAGALSGVETQVWVQQGIYFPSATVRVPSGVLLYGGFSGNETALFQRNYANNTTIIDGQNSFSVVCLGIGAVLDGFAVINGLANLMPTPYGGGVWMENNARVENCYILDNQAGKYGGGIYAEGDGLVYNTLFSGNIAGTDGLAIWGTTLEVRNITASQNSLWGDPVILDENRCIVATPAWTILGRQGFTTDNVWLADTLLWSDAVTVSTCSKTLYNGGSNPPPMFHSDCRSNPNQKGDLFSWCAVKRFGEDLCPKPWRVPSWEEFVILNQNFGGTGTNNQTNTTIVDNYLSFWGGSYSGYSNPTGSLTDQGTGAFYWSMSEFDLALGLGQSFYTNGLIFPRLTAEKNHGYALRCVRFCPRSVVTLTSGVNTRTQSVCQNTPIEPVTHSFGGAATGVTLTWEPSVPEGIFGDADYFYGIPTTPGVYKWTITTTGDNTCPPRIDTGSITIHALPLPVIIAEPTSICDSVILIASGGNGGTIFWQNTTNNGTNTTLGTTPQTVKADGTYYFRARSEHGCWGEQGSREVVIHTAPRITVHPDTTERSTVEGGTFPALSVSATSALLLTYQWYSNTSNSNTGGTLVSGATSATFTPSGAVIGTLYYYCVVSNILCADVVSNVSGAHIVESIKIDTNRCNNAIPGWGESLGTVSFATNQIWIIGNQAWSDAVQTSVCSEKTTYHGGLVSTSNFNADCRSNPNRKGDFFSWCAVIRFQDELCPHPWRVPTNRDFIDLDIALGGSGENNLYSNTTQLDKYLNTWGGNYHGLSSHGENATGTGNYWSQSEGTYGHNARGLLIMNNAYNFRILPSYVFPKQDGLTLRCIRDTVFPVDTNNCFLKTPEWGNSLGAVSFATNQTWLVGNQVWSDAVQAASCSNRTTYNGGSQTDTVFNTDCRSNPNYKGDYFSWCAVARFKDSLCPDNWRLPTQDDFNNLMNVLGTNPAPFIGSGWGGVYGGMVTNNGARQQGEVGYYWSENAYTSDGYNGSTFHIRAPFVNGGAVTSKGNGLTLRCVRDTTPPPIAVASCNNNTGWGASLGKVSFATDSTWTVGNQIWSDAVQAANCNNKTSFNGGTTWPANLNADCCSNPGWKGDLFSWCAVARFANTLCPSPWRVPTFNDFCELDKIFVTTPNCQMWTHDMAALNNYIQYWQPEFAGGLVGENSTYINSGRVAYYWSSEEYSTISSFWLPIYNPNYTIAVGDYIRVDKNWGLNLRCVRDKE